jgi:hypothetical protein
MVRLAKLAILIDRNNNNVFSTKSTIKTSEVMGLFSSIKKLKQELQVYFLHTMDAKFAHFFLEKTSLLSIMGSG